MCFSHRDNSHRLSLNISYTVIIMGTIWRCTALTIIVIALFGRYWSAWRKCVNSRFIAATGLMTTFQSVREVFKCKYDPFIDIRSSKTLIVELRYPGSFYAINEALY